MKILKMYFLICLYYFTFLAKGHDFFKSSSDLTEYSVFKNGFYYKNQPQLKFNLKRDLTKKQPKVIKSIFWFFYQQ